MSTNAKDHLCDITCSGLTGEGLPSTTLREVRRAREHAQREPSVEFGSPEAAMVDMSAKMRQRLTGNNIKGKPDR